jgi:serine/threonine protein phosphatase 1
MLRRLTQRFFARDSALPEAPRDFGVPEGVRVYAVGDIHGRAKLTAKMLEAIASDAAQHAGKKIIEVFLGDYIDRGMQSREVVELLLVPAAAGHERICLMGNHEVTLLRFLSAPTCLREWGSYGGYATLTSYGLGIPASMAPAALATVRDQFAKNLPPSHRAFYENLKLSYVVGDYLFVHAGILPNVALENQSRESLLWIRDAFLNHQNYFDYYVVHGHTPVAVPQLLHHRANLDVSAATSSSLCCLVMDGSDRKTILITE